MLARQFGFPLPIAVTVRDLELGEAVKRVRGDWRTGLRLVRVCRTRTAEEKEAWSTRYARLTKNPHRGQMVRHAMATRPSIDLRLENFRLFQDSGWFKLCPLTCLVGRNSSGKSSVLSAILLLKQSIEQEAMGTALMPLTLSGPYCDLGNFSDVVYNHDESSEISLSLSTDFSDLRSMADNRSAPFVDLAVRRPRQYGYGYYYYGGRYEMELPDKGTIKASFHFSVDEPFGPGLSRFEITVDGSGSASFVRTVSGERREHWRVYTTTLPPKSLALRAAQRTFFPWIEIRTSSYGRSSPRAKHRIRVFVSAAQRLFRFVQQCLVQSDFIGPFRTPPERRYAFGGFNSSRRGPTGEQAIDLLITEALLQKDGKRPLHTALSFWIRHLKLADSLDVKDIAKRLNLFEVDIEGAGLGTKANLADVGFGVSQVLPVLVQGLLMRSGGIYLVQQPEIHLHPDAQAGLADFFIYLASYGVITVVETHSEYLLLRLRRRLAEGAKPVSLGLPIEQRNVPPLTARDVAVLLTGSDESNARVQQIQIDKSFQFENLPRGFMSQAIDDRIALLNAVGKEDA